MSQSRNKAKAPAVSDFEPGAKVATDGPAADLSRPLESQPGTDHFAAFEERRVEMIQEWDGKISDLKARAAGLREQSQTKEGEFRRLAHFATSAADQNRIATLQTEAGNLAQEARRLTNVDLPQLEHERLNIVAGNHSTLVALRLVAQNRVAADVLARQPEKLPRFVILEAHFGWRENEQMVNFAEGQIVRDAAIIRQLIAHNAPLEFGGH